MASKAIAYIIAFIILAQAAFALETVFDNWLYSGQSFNVEGQTFIIYKGVYNREIIADYGQGSLFVKNNSCQQTGNVRICLDNIEYYHTARADRMKVRAISLAPDITLTRTASDTELEAEDEAIITVTIVNAGGLAKNLTYTDIYPEGMKVERIDGISEPVDGRVVWTKRVLKTETVEFSYKVIVKEVLERGIVAKLTYFDGRKLKTIRSSTITLKSTPRMLHEFILGTDAIRLGRKNNITLNLTSKELLDSKIQAEVIVDPEITITKIPKGFKKISDTLYKADIEINKIPENRSLNLSKAYYFEFLGTKTGKFYIKANIKYSTDDFTDRELPELKEGITFSQKGVKARTNLDDYELEANQARTLRIWLQNLNPEITLKNVLVKIDGGGLLRLEDTFIRELAAHVHKKIIEQDFFAPNVSSGKGYTIKVDVSYDTNYEKNFTSSFLFTETVSVIKDVIISQSKDVSTVESGDEITVTVKVKNPRKTKLSNILIEDTIPEEFTVLGTTRTRLTLDVNDEQTAYTYVLKAPRLKKETIYTINTAATYSDEDAAQIYKNPQPYRVVSSTDITVKPQKFDLTATRTVTGDITLGDVFDVKYTLKNPTSDTIAKKIQLVLPLQNEFDLVGEKRRINVGTLEPGEEIIITNTVQRRAKEKGTASLEKTKVLYTNEFGEEFEVNVSATSVKVADKPSSDATFVFVAKTVKDKANNTDFFEVLINVTSTGTSIALVELDDGKIRREFSILNGSTFNVTYLKKIETAGSHTLNPATILYKVGNAKYLTGSSSPKIVIVDNPVVSIQKTAPGTVNSLENFDVELTIRQLASGVTNITIFDESELHYDELTDEVINTYVKNFKKQGAQILPAARLTYIYKGKLYEITSESPSINVLEKNLLSIEKTVSVAEAKPDEKVELTLVLKSFAKDEINLELTDEGETWKITLAPEEEKVITHSVNAKTLEAATATFIYNDEGRTISSNIPQFTFIEPENGKVIKEKSLVKKILDLLIGIVTWKRA